MYSLVLEVSEDADPGQLIELNNQVIPPFPNGEKPAPIIDIVKAKPHLLRFLNSDPEPKTTDLPLNRSKTLCILAVPSWISEFFIYLNSHSSDLIAECLEGLLLIRTYLSNNYFSTVVLFFSTQSAADNFFTLFSGRDFSEPSNEYCYIGFLGEINYTQKLVLKKDCIEIPLCPICLERLDVSISMVYGVLRTESKGLEGKRWIDSLALCKVCSQLGNELKTGCEGCLEMTDLWACLICGYKGCGRYQAAHSKSHYQETGHNFTIELCSQRIWDYINDKYVHRLLHGRETLILDPQFSQMAKENIERMVNEYNHLISLQLEQQRVYYEQKISSIMINKNENLHEEYKAAKSENDYLKRQVSKVKACKRKKEAKESILVQMIRENLELEEMNKNLKEYVDKPQDLWIFEDKKSKNTYLKLERLRLELENIMNCLK